MYLRKNKNKASRGGATYLSIAHNVWLPGKNNKKGQSRPIIIASLGNEASSDIDIARDVVSAIGTILPQFYSARGEDKLPGILAAKEIRRIEPFLKSLVSRELALSKHFPSNSNRVEVLESFIRERINDQNPANLSKTEILNLIRARFEIEAADVSDPIDRNNNQEPSMISSKEKARKLLNALYYTPQVPPALYELLELLVNELPDYK